MPRESDNERPHGGVIMAHKTKTRPKTKKTTKRAARKLKLATARKTKAKKPRVTIAANSKKPKERSVTEVAATHFKNLDYELGHLIPSAWWRHTA